MPSLITRGYGRFSVETNNNVMSGVMSGVITLDKSKFMSIAIPVKGRKIKEYFVDSVLSEVRKQTPSALASDIFEVLKTFPASDDSVSKFLIYVPDITPEDSQGNFYLISSDGNSKEINGITVKMKDYSSFYDKELKFNWTTEDNL